MAEYEYSDPMTEGGGPTLAQKSSYRQLWTGETYQATLLGGGALGISVSALLDTDEPVVTGIDSGSAAEQAGIVQGSKILEVNGSKHLPYQDALAAMKSAQCTGRVVLILEKPPSMYQVTLGPGPLGLTLHMTKLTGQAPVITALDRWGPAEQAGIITGSLVVSVNGEPVYRYQEALAAIKAASRPLVLTLEKPAVLVVRVPLVQVRNRLVALAAIKPPLLNAATLDSAPPRLDSHWH
jgi:predicted metalloprotease with PDZ domain